MAGSSGIVAITWVEEFQKRMQGRLNVGNLINVILPKLSKIAAKVIKVADLNSANHCFIGHMIPDISEAITRVLHGHDHHRGDHHDARLRDVLLHGFQPHDHECAYHWLLSQH